MTWFDGLTYEQLLYLRRELASPTELPDDIAWGVFTKWAESTNRVGRLHDRRPVPADDRALEAAERGAVGRT